MAHQKNKLTGQQGFDAYYQDLFGARWTSLRAALLQEPTYAQWNGGGQEPYFLDTGSVLAALSLPLFGAQSILDLCAAPGGKSIILASRMEKSATLLSNDRSAARKQRLVKVCDTCLAPETRERVTVTCSDGATWCLRQTDCFDRILLDAPCSSERHVLSDPKYLAEWSPSRIKSLAIEQWSLLSSAFRMLKNGGYMIYSTCALCPAENDDVVQRLFKKFDGVECCDIDFDAIKQTAPQGITLPDVEKTTYGYHVLPDAQQGAGPLFFSLIKKCRTE